jgi:hypothetical protein
MTTPHAVTVASKFWLVRVCVLREVLLAGRGGYIPIGVCSGMVTL